MTWEIGEEVRRWGGEVRRWGGEEVRRWGGEEVRRWGGEEVRRWGGERESLQVCARKWCKGERECAGRIEDFEFWREISASGSAVRHLQLIQEAMAAQAPKYRFRVLDVNTIVSQLVEVGISVTPADLENPQPQSVSTFHNDITDTSSTHTIIIFIPKHTWTSTSLI